MILEEFINIAYKGYFLNIYQKKQKLNIQEICKTIIQEFNSKYSQEHFGNIYGQIVYIHMFMDAD